MYFFIDKKGEKVYNIYVKIRKGSSIMTVRNYTKRDLVKVEQTTLMYDGHQLDHINYFKNGAVVGYSDKQEKEFLVVLKARD